MKSACFPTDSSFRARCGAGWSGWGLALLLILLALGACGRSSAPVPVGSLLPVPEGLVAWQRESRALVAWRVPEERATGLQGGLEAFVLLIDRLPLNCHSCPPDESRELALPLHVESLVVEGDRAIYRFPLPAPAATWRFRIAVRLGVGQGLFSAPVFLDTPARVPVHQLRWAPAQGISGGRGIRLYWLPRRERVVQILTENKAMVAQDKFFRANLYRREGRAPWPLRPLNIRPLETGQLIVQAPADKAVEYQLRLVDRFGNEGPASPTIAIGGGTARR